MKEELKGVEALESIITSLFKKFGIANITIDKEYAYHYITENITFKLTHTTVDFWFDEFVYKRFNIELDSSNSFIFSILHEIGHHKTIDDIPQDIQDAIDRKKETYQKLINKKFMPMFYCKKIEFDYFTLYDELMATRWAVWYWRTHQEEIQKITKKAKLALMQFYKINGVIE